METFLHVETDQQRICGWLTLAPLALVDDGQEVMTAECCWIALVEQTLCRG